MEISDALDAIVVKRWKKGLFVVEGALQRLM